MRKKFLSALLLGLVTLGATTTMTSCKDYDDDISSLNKQISELKGIVDQKEQTINSSIASLQAAIQQANNDHATKAALEAARAALQSAIDANYNTLTEKDSKLDAAIAKAQSAADAASKLAADNKTASDQADAKLQENIDKVASDLATANAKLGTLSDDLKNAFGKIGELNAALAAQDSTLKVELKKGDDATLAAALAEVKKVQKKLEAADAAADKALKEEIARVDAKIEGVKTSVDDLKDLHDALAADVSEITNTTIPNIINNVNALENKIDAVDAKLNKLSVALAKDLRSLVFIPDLYVDGIETIEYPYISDLAMEEVKGTAINNHKGVSVDAFSDYQEDAAAPFYLGKAIGVDYHMNPANSATVAADVQGWTGRSVEVATRSAASALTLNKVDALFQNKSGILTAGLQIANPQLIGNGPEKIEEGATGNKSYGKDDVIALQVKTKTEENPLVTSDYAMLSAEVFTPEAIAWTAESKQKGDEVCPVKADATKHMWDTPQEALKNEPVCFLPYNTDGTDIVLSKWIETHVAKVCAIKGHSNELFTWNYGEEKAWGLKYIFEMVDYTAGGNTTSDSRYATIDEKGAMMAYDVTDEGKTDLSSKANASMVGREPLVRVRLVTEDGKTTLLDGYVLVQISRAADPAQEKANLTIDKYPGTEATFDLCNAENVMFTTWAQFDDYVLNKLELSKDEFDAQYTLDEKTAGQANVYKDEKGTLINEGTVLYYADETSTTNHVFKWILTPAELEALTHDTTTPVEVVRYVRYEGNAAAKYKYVYIKFVTTLDRKAIAKTGIKEKIGAGDYGKYWYGENGGNGWDAVALNLDFPNANGTPTTWKATLLNAFVHNNVQFTNAEVKEGKFFFAPKTTTITDAHKGVWTITAQSSAADKTWNKFVCIYDGTDNGHGQEFTYGTDEANANVLNKCAIDYNAGCFANTSLYAVKGGKYIKIAEMNPANGEITFVASEANYTKAEIEAATIDYKALDLVLNAIGYKDADHTNISEELHTFVGYVGATACPMVDGEDKARLVAVDIFSEANAEHKPVFIASWQRPLNMLDSDPAPVVDAHDNGEVISVFDHLAFYDWRNVSCEKQNKWYWGFYGICGIRYNTDPKNVLTNMHNPSGACDKKLADVSKNVHLWAVTDYNPTTGAVTKAADNYTFNKAFTIQGKTKDKNQAMLDVMATANWQKNIGWIYYENNGNNVKSFKVKVPVEIFYQWGHFDSYITIEIASTIGNEGAAKRK